MLRDILKFTAKLSDMSDDKLDRVDVKHAIDVLYHKARIVQRSWKRDLEEVKLADPNDMRLSTYPHSIVTFLGGRSGN